MVAALNKLTTVLNATSPLVLTNQDDTALYQNSSGTPLAPAGTNGAAVSIAYSYVPPGNIALLSRPGESVLLTQESRELPLSMRFLKDDWPPEINAAYFSKNAPGLRQAPEAPKAPDHDTVSPVKNKFTSFDFKKASAGLNQTDTLTAIKTSSNSLDISI